jgi:hypothetical protein
MSPQPICKHLRTKSMYIPALARPSATATGEAPESELEHSSPCWCNCTMTETGPDDRPVGRLACRTGRRCYEE